MFNLNIYLYSLKRQQIEMSLRKLGFSCWITSLDLITLAQEGVRGCNLQMELKIPSWIPRLKAKTLQQITMLMATPCIDIDLKQPATISWWLDKQQSHPTYAGIQKQQSHPTYAGIQEQMTWCKINFTGNMGVKFQFPNSKFFYSSTVLASW